MLRRSVRPGRANLLKRYRESYSAQLCPICAYPIARGALKLAVWSRKGPKVVAPGAVAGGAAEEPRYACPSCGTPLFEKCEHCAASRHSLLPYCDHCGQEKSVPELERESE